MGQETKLDEFDKEEWWDVMRLAVNQLGGSISRDEFEKYWDDFCAMKAQKQRH